MISSRTTAAEPQLDWSVHADPLHWPISAKTFLAEAVLQVGRALCEPWYDEEPAALAKPVGPCLPELDEAFHGEEPVAAVHAQYRAVVLSEISFSDYWEMVEADREGTEPSPDEPITRDHWEQVLVDISFRENSRLHAQRAILHVARFLAKNAVMGALRTYGGRIPGGRPEELPSHFWEVHDPRPRIASCSLDVKDWANPAAAPTHVVFVEPEDLQKLVAGIKPNGRVNLIPELEGATARPDLYAVSTLEVAAWLKSMMEDPSHHNWKSGRFRRDAEEKFGSRVGGEVWKRAWKKATDAHPWFSRPGAPRTD